VVIKETIYHQVTKWTVVNGVAITPASLITDCKRRFAVIKVLGRRVACNHARRSQKCTSKLTTNKMW